MTPDRVSELARPERREAKCCVTCRFSDADAGETLTTRCIKHGDYPFLWQVCDDHKTEDGQDFLLRAALRSAAEGKVNRVVVLTGPPRD